jgi:phosphosulfolactate synthase (CoM biosynthesis protein A)
MCSSIINPGYHSCKKIKFYHDYGILVSTGSTITEYSFAEKLFESFILEAARIGFDIIE